MASYTPITNTLDFSVAFKPTSAFPLDARSMFGSYESAVAAAATAENAGSSNTIYYIGQQLTVFENDIVSTYLIQPDKSLKAVGAAVVGDDKTIAVGEDGTLSLKNFGVKYYKYNDADNVISGDYTYPDNMPQDASENDFVKISDTYYKYTDGAWAVTDETPKTSSYYTVVDGWKAGLEPKVVSNDAGNGYEIAWYEPSTTTVEGLTSTIGTLNTRVDQIADRTTNVEADLNTLKGDADTEGSVKNTVAEAVSKLMDNPDETMNSIKELVDWTTEHASDYLELQNSVTANTQNIGTINETIGKLGTAANENKEAFATAAQGAKADTAVQSVVAGEVNGHISVDETDITVYELGKASVTDLGGIKADGSSISVNEEGVASVAAVDHTKITGLDTQLTSTKESAVTESNEYTDTNAVKVTSVVKTSDDAASDVESASEAKIISEKLFIDAMTWKDHM